MSQAFESIAQGLREALALCATGNGGSKAAGVGIGFVECDGERAAGGNAGIGVIGWLLALRSSNDFVASVGQSI